MHCDKVVYEDYNSIVAEVINIKECVRTYIAANYLQIVPISAALPVLIAHMAIDNDAELQSRELLFIK